MKNLCRLGCKFDLDQSERKSSQVNASARKPWPNEVEVDPSLQLASTCVSVWPALKCKYKCNISTVGSVSFGVVTKLHI